MKSGYQGNKKSFRIWIFALIILVFWLIYDGQRRTKLITAQLDYSEFLSYVESDKISEVVFEGEKISGKLKENELKGKIFFVSYGPHDRDVIKLLESKGVKFKFTRLSQISLL